MKIKQSWPSKIFDGFNHMFMIVLVFITLYPLVYVLFASVSDPKLLLSHQGLLFKWLGDATLKGYEITFQNPNIIIGYRNTIFYVVIGTIINILLTAIGAYVLSRKHFLLRKQMTFMVVLTMFFNGGIIPMFFVVKQLGIYDTPLAILLPGAINTYNLIIMRTFFYNIPDSLEEAAIIDGASDFDVFWKVVLPLSKPVIAVMVLYYGVGHWNSWFEASIYLRNRDFYPLQLFLREILLVNATGSTATDSSMMMEESLYKELVQYCTIIVSTVPILLIYPFLQKYFVKGVMIGAVKE